MKKNIVFISISLGLIILLGIGVSYSMWNITTSQDTTNTAYTECFDLSMTNQENNISLDNAYPISNDKGKSLTPYSFTITNTCDITTEYSVNLEVLKDSTLSSKFIDVMFEGNINLLSSYDSTDKVNTNSLESRKLTTGILKSQESKDYSLRLWIDYNTTLEDLNNKIKTFKSKIVVVGKPINYTGDTVFNFDYTGAEQTFIAPVSGTYKLETWGAQGGSMEHEGGFGGYSIGYTKLKTNNIKYINVGGQGGSGNYHKSETGYGGAGGYNGGGTGGLAATINESSKIYYYVSGAGGGGSTHLSNKSGLLKSLNNYRSDIIIVAGGGGGDASWRSAGSAGGYKGSDAPLSYDQYGDVFPYDVFGGGQVGLDELFGQGRNATSRVVGNAWGSEGKGGGGGGYYGGEAILIDGIHTDSGGAGGSGYIGNSFLTNKVMYCYNCEESNEESTKTISTTCNEETPTSNCSKKGNGYARITLISIDK